MLQIAICDDNHKDLSNFSALVNEYIAEKEFSADIFEFSHPDVLLSTCEKERFHLYILDIVMPMVDGITLGKEIRRLDKEAQIIYVTTEEAFALQSFVANPINFLVKPVKKQELFDTLELALSKIQTEDDALTVKTKDGIRTISQHKILCCEYSDRSVAYTLLGGETLHSLSTGQTFSQQIAPLLENEDFLQPHSSFAINLRSVEKLTREAFILHGGIIVPVSKKQCAAVRDRYLNYRLAREGR